MPRRWEHLIAPLADDLVPSDLQSLLMTVYQQRARRQTEAGLMERAAAPMCAPSTADVRLLRRFDDVAFQTAADFEAVELAPVCPLGTSQVLGGIDQNSVLTAIRSAEVPGDSTPMLALACARRRKKSRTAEPVRLCASHRVMRLQPFDIPGFTPHFRLFALVTAGRDTGSDAFELQHLREHLSFYLELFRALNEAGFSLQNPLVEIGDVSVSEALLSAAGVSREDVHQVVRAHRPGGSEKLLASHGLSLPGPVSDPAELHGVPDPQLTRLLQVKKHVFDPLAAAYPEAQFRVNLSRLEGLGYYTGLCLRVSPENRSGDRFAVADGGFTNWTARLLQDRKERLLTSGIGAEFIARAYR